MRCARSSVAPPRSFWPCRPSSPLRRPEAITGGQADGVAHPNVGLVLSAARICDVNARFRCIGYACHPTVVLTAGHCTDGTVGKTLVTSARPSPSSRRRLFPGRRRHGDGGSRRPFTPPCPRGTRRHRPHASRVQRLHRRPAPERRGCRDVGHPGSVVRTSPLLRGLPPVTTCRRSPSQR